MVLARSMPILRVFTEMAGFDILDFNYGNTVLTKVTTLEGISCD